MQLGTIQLSEQEKNLRLRFITEYLKDYNSYAACLRIGFESEFAFEYARKFMNEPYTRKLLLDIERKSNKDDPEIIKVKQQEDEALIYATLRDVANNGSGASKVRAALALAKLNGILDEKEQEETIESGVMLMPMVQNNEDWETQAVDSQTALMKTVNE